MGDGPEAKTQLGRILVRERALTGEALSRLLEAPRRGGERLASAAVRTSAVSARAALRALGEQRGVAALDLARMAFPLASLARLPRDVARAHRALPVLEAEGTLHVAMADPGDRRALDELAFVTGLAVRPYVALLGALGRAIDVAYAAAARGDATFDAPPDLLGRSEEGEAPATIACEEDLAAFAIAPVARHGQTSRDSLAGDPDPVGEVRGLDAPLHTEAPKRAATSAPAGEHSVLVVDDSEDIRRLLVRVLTEKGYVVHEAADGDAALSAVREHAPGVVLLDAMLPGVHGFDVCRRIKGSRRFGHIPVIMMSAVYRGWRFAEDLEHAYGVAHFLEKPFRIGDVLAAVQAAVRGEGPAVRASDEVRGEAGEALRAGIAAYAAGDVEAAVAHLKRGIGLDPQAFRLHYHLGLLYGKREDLFEAIQTLEKAVELRPRDFSALKNLAVLYERAGFRLKATEMWERAMGSAPDEDTRANVKKHLMGLL